MPNKTAGRYSRGEGNRLQVECLEAIFSIFTATQGIRFLFTLPFNVLMCKYLPCLPLGHVGYHI